MANALLAVVLVNPDNSLDELQRALALVFLSLFVGFSAWFLVAHKRSYTHYFNQVRCLER